MQNVQITKSDEPSIREWLNCETAEVDAAGDVWVAEPMDGHWLNDDKKAEYIAWREAQ